MKINPVNYEINSKQSFKAATLSINAFSDTHGELLLANNALEEMRTRQQDIFSKETPSSKNILAVCGDWFMDGGKKGYVSDPEKETAKFQLAMFNEMISQIKNFAGSITTIFTLGNHEFDGGIQILDDVLKDIDADVLVSNLDVNGSCGLSKTISKNKIINEKEIILSDDKNPDLQHHILFLGISPVNMFSYQKNMEGIGLINNIPKVQRYVSKEDYKETTDVCRKKIAQFKNENPNGVVVLMSHTGVGFADNLAKTSDVDLILDGHEHKDAIRFVNGTPIVPLSQNFRKIVNAKINIDDEGFLENIGIKSFSPIENKRKGPLLAFYKELFKEDLRRIYTIETDKDIEFLDLKNLRQSNNYLANFVTDSILEELRKKDSSIDFFALNSSSIRHPLRVSKDKPTISPFDVMNILSGIKEEDGEVMTTMLTGSDIAYLILDNFIFNKDMPQQNPLIHYSGLIVDRKRMLEEFSSGTSIDDLIKNVIDARTNEPISLTKEYKLANVEKYFNKSQNSIIRELKKVSEYTGSSVQELLKEHFASSNGVLQAKCDERIL